MLAGRDAERESAAAARGRRRSRHESVCARAGTRFQRPLAGGVARATEPEPTMTVVVVALAGAAARPTAPAPSISRGEHETRKFADRTPLHVSPLDSVGRGSSDLTSLQRSFNGNAGQLSMPRAGWAPVGTQKARVHE